MNTLPIFEAVGRHLSVANAADELNLTAGAVSRQIKNLETHLGCELFIRSHRKIEFSPEGSLYWADVRSAMSELRLATHNIAVTADKRELVISCPRLFLQKCVMPVLSKFYEEHPDIDVKFVVGSSSPTADADIDGAIGIGHHNRGSFISEPLVAGNLSAVCSPDYLETQTKPKAIEDLKRMTLLRSTEFEKNWELWLGDEAEDVFKAARFIDFENAGLDITAASEGLGVAMVRLNLVQHEIDKGELVAVLEDRTVPDSYSFFYSDTKLNSEKFKRFRRWLKSAVNS